MYTFKETRFDDEFVFLDDSSRGISVALPRRGTQSFVAVGKGEWRPLYEVTASRGDSADLYVYQGGYFFRSQGGYWRERKAGQTTTYYFKERGFDKNFILLQDAVRPLAIALPKRGGRALISGTGRPWADLFDVRD